MDIIVLRFGERCCFHLQGRCGPQLERGRFCEIEGNNSQRTGNCLVRVRNGEEKLPLGGDKLQKGLTTSARRPQGVPVKEQEAMKQQF
jgi:hypothetical protein